MTAQHPITRVVTGALLSAATVLGLLTLMPVTAAAAASTAAGEVAWGIRPADNEHGSGRPNFAYGLAPGDEVEDAVVVTNHSDVAIELALYAADGFTTPSGDLDLVTGDAQSTAVGAWATTDAESVSLDPGESREVAFTLRLPQDARPGDHLGGVVTSLVTQEQGGTIVLDRRLSNRLSVRVTGPLTTAASVSIVEVSPGTGVNPFAPRPTTVTYTVTNTGNVRMYATEEVTVSGVLGSSSTTLRGDQTPELLPGDSLERTVELEAVTPLRVTAQVSLHPVGVGVGGGAAMTAGAEAGRWAVHWSHGVALALVLGLVGALIVRRRRPAPAASVD